MPTVNQKGVAHLFILLILIAAVVLGVYLVRNKTDLLPQAASGPIAPRTALSFQANSNTVRVGEEFNLDVIVSSDFDAANTFTAKIVYDPSKLEVVKINPGVTDTATTSGYFIKKWIEQTDDKNGNIILSGAVPNPGFKTTPGNPGKMATVTLKGKTVSQAAIGYDREGSGIYRNSDNQNILSSTDAWSLNITPMPSGVPDVDTDKDGFLDGHELFYGTDPIKACGVNAWPPDVNDDTHVNGGDVSFMAPYINGAKQYNKRYDLNRNGNISQDDIVVIQRYFLKSCVPTSTPAGISVSPASVNIELNRIDAKNGVILGDAMKIITDKNAYADTWVIESNKVRDGFGFWTDASGVTKGSVFVNQLFINSSKADGVYSGTAKIKYYKDGNLVEEGPALTYKITLRSTVSSPVPCPTGMLGVSDPQNGGSAVFKCVPVSTPAPSATPIPPPVDGKRADLYKDSRKPNFINDQDVSVFFTKCAEKGVELFGQPASRQPICDILNDGKITVQDWAILIKFRNQSV